MEVALLMILRECTLWRGLWFLRLAGGEGGEEFRDGSTVDGFGGEEEARGKVWGEVGGDHDGGGVEEDDVAAGAFFSAEDGAEDRGVGGCVGAAGDVGG